MTAPGPGKLAAFAGIPRFRRDQLAGFRFGWEAYGDLYHVEVAGHDIWVCSHPDQVKEVLVDGRDVWRRIEETSWGQPFGLRMALGEGLLTTDGSEWQWRRHLINPAFHRELVNAMVKKMIDAGNEMIGRLEEAAATGVTVDLLSEMKRVTQDIITRTMFSADLEHEGGKVGDAVDEALVYVARQSRSLVDLPVRLPTRARTRFNRAMTDIDDAVYRSIRHRRQSDDHGDDLLGLLLSARDAETGDQLDDDQIRNEVATIYGAGHETTANALTWAWHELMQEPHVLERLQAEVDTVSLEIKELEYTQKVLEETLRFRPPVPINGRMATAPTRLAGYPVKYGATAVLVVTNIHRHPEFWDRPDVFDPGRFSPQAKSDRARFAYIPFGAGPHMCIGSSFAMIEAVLLLAMMAGRFTFHPVGDLPRGQATAVTMKPEGGLPVHVEER
jgi:cytochrome P450